VPTRQRLPVNGHVHADLSLYRSASELALDPVQVHRQAEPG
jgi:hypothetical protein